MIYCIGSRDQKVCKIGYTKGLKSRLSAIQTHCPFPLTCFALIEGDHEAERALHSKFHHLKTNGEWFALDDAIASHFGFEMWPAVHLWAVSLSYSTNGSYQHKVTTVFADSEPDALSQAKIKLNVKGRFLRGWGAQVPAEHIQAAQSSINGDHEAANTLRLKALDPERKREPKKVLTVTKEVCCLVVTTAQAKTIKKADQPEYYNVLRTVCLENDVAIDRDALPEGTRYLSEFRGGKLTIWEAAMEDE